jgi:hypothetical protein
VLKHVVKRRCDRNSCIIDGIILCINGKPAKKSSKVNNNSKFRGGNSHCAPQWSFINSWLGCEHFNEAKFLYHEEHGSPGWYRFLLHDWLYLLCLSLYLYSQHMVWFGSFDIMKTQSYEWRKGVLAKHMNNTWCTKRRCKLQWLNQVLCMEHNLKQGINSFNMFSNILWLVLRLNSKWNQHYKFWTIPTINNYTFKRQRTTNEPCSVGEHKMTATK